MNAENAFISSIAAQLQVFESHGKSSFTQDAGGAIS
jgi:hypothetical protein